MNTELLQRFIEDEFLTRFRYIEIISRSLTLNDNILEVMQKINARAKDATETYENFLNDPTTFY